MPAEDKEWVRAVSASTATTSWACAQGPSASSTSSGAAAPASQAEDHTVNVAEAQGTRIRLTSAPPRGTPTVRAIPTTHRHRWSRVKQGDEAGADGVSRAASAGSSR